MAIKKGAPFPKLEAEDFLGYNEGQIATVWEVCLNYLFYHTLFFCD